MPDKDADGLSAGAILRHTLLLLGVEPHLIKVHTISKGNNIHTEDEREKMAANSPSYVFVIDQGSRPGPSIIDGPHIGLIIDHHHATESDFPMGSEHVRMCNANANDIITDIPLQVTACSSPPVATSALLTYMICQPLHADVEERCDWLCIVGTHGDLGNTIKWSPPFPDMTGAFKKYTKKRLNDVVSLVNAPRRTATFDSSSAFEALCDTTEPASVLSNTRLLAARAEVNAEVERCTHTAPKFSADGKVAVFRIESECQVHPVIATRWAGHLNSKALEIVLVANEGYLPEKVNFSCRIARCARGRDPQVNIIESLKAYASLPEVDDCESSVEQPPLLERLGHDFARGHVQASGGIVRKEEFEELMQKMRIGVKSQAKSQNSPIKSPGDSKQSNTLLSYFKRG